MFVLVTLEYLAPLDEVARHTDDHRAYLRGLHAEGKLVASGPFVPRTGGALLLRVADADELAAIVRDDPFNARGIARYTTREWALTIGEEALTRAAERPIATC